MQLPEFHALGMATGQGIGRRLPQVQDWPELLQAIKSNVHGHAWVRGHELRCGGPETGFAARIERYLRKAARERLSEETAIVAARGGVTVRSVAIGDASSRWGSCSASGSIRYNWRLLLAPPHLLDWVVAHEVAHRVHMNHGVDFRALEAKLFDGDVVAARAELRALGPRLKRIGRRV